MTYGHAHAQQDPGDRKPRKRPTANRDRSRRTPTTGRTVNGCRVATRLATGHRHGTAADPEPSVTVRHVRYGASGSVPPALIYLYMHMRGRSLTATLTATPPNKHSPREIRVTHGARTQLLSKPPFETVELHSDYARLDSGDRQGMRSPKAAILLSARPNGECLTRDETINELAE